MTAKRKTTKSKIVQYVLHVKGDIEPNFFKNWSEAEEYILDRGEVESCVLEFNGVSLSEGNFDYTSLDFDMTLFEIYDDGTTKEKILDVKAETTVDIVWKYNLRDYEG